MRTVRTILFVPLVVAPALVALPPAAAAEDMLAQPPVPKPRPIPAEPQRSVVEKPAPDRTMPDRTIPERTVLQAIARREAQLADVPFDLVDAVMKVESDYRPDRVGDVGEIGLMQVRPGTAAMLGFHGSAGDLADPATNIHFGTSYLAGAWHLAHGNVCRALMKYRAGHGNESMTPLSVLYCQRARNHLAGTGSPLAALIQPVDLVADAPGTAVPDGVRSAMPARRPDFAGMTPPGESLTANGRPKTGAAFWAAFGARVRRINAGLEARWRHTASR